jgi:hypothetical protein
MQDVKDRYFKSPPLLEEVGRDMGGFYRRFMVCGS